MRKRLPDLLRDERHERVQELERLDEDIAEDVLCVLARGLILAVEAVLRQLDEPVAVDIPDKAVDLGSSQTHLIVLQIVGHGTGHLIQLGEHPLVAHVQQLFTGQTRLKVLGQVHQHKAGGVPQLIGKVAARLNLFVGISHIVSGAVAVGKSKAQSDPRRTCQ